MAEYVEVVIKIPEEEYKIIKNYAAPMTWCEHLIAKGKPLPKGHGRLIDISEYFKKEFGDAREFLDKATTIIEADKAESEE